MNRSAEGRPLTTAEQALWYAQQLAPANPAYLCAHAVSLRGAVRTARLLAAIDTVTAAAANLWITVRDSPDGQRATAGPPTGCPIRDLRAEPDPAGAAAAWMRADHTTGVPMDRPGMFAQALLILAEDHVVWYLRAHHLLLDGYGFTLLADRVAAVYRDETTVVGFPPAERLVADERAYRDSPRRIADREHWHAHLAARPPAMSLSEVVAAPDVPHRVAGVLSADTCAGLRAVADSLGVAWAELAMIATAVYLRRVTGSSEVAVGLPLMNRLGSAAARIPSTVVNVLPLWLVIDDRGSLRALVRQVRAALRELRRHGRYRYEDLQRELGLVGGGRRLAGPSVNIKPYPEPLRFGDALAEVTALATGPVPDLEFSLWPDPAGDRVRLSAAANPAAYDAATVAAHRDRLSHLLDQLAAADPDAPLAELEIATPAERRQVLRDFNDTDAPLPPVTLTELLERHATSDDLAVVAPDGQLSYVELHRSADRLAVELVARGAGPGSLVALALPRGLDLMVALLATLKAGAAYLPLELSHPPARTAQLLAAAAPVCLLAHAATAVERAGATPWLDPAAVTGAAAPVRIRPATPEDPAYVIYTSGSTGAPKGVVVPHRGIVNRLLWMQRHFGLAPDDRVLQKTPYGFDVSVWEFFWPLTEGATVVLARPDGHRDPDYLAELIRDAGITTVHFVPSMLRAFLDAGQAGACGRTLRRVVCSGEELPAELVRTFTRQVGAPLHNLYGPTEASVDVTCHDCAPDEPGPVPIGRPVDNTRLYVLDPAGRPAPPGVIGELYLAGAQLATGYLGRPDLTAERFVGDPFGGPGERMYRTGDLARWRRDGALEFHGRADRQIKVRGFRIEPAEIEAALTADPTVAAAAVLTWPDAPDRLCGYVTAAPDADCDPEAVRSRVAQRLPDHLVPATVTLLAELPLNTSGKLDRGALPPPRWVASGTQAPRNPHEELLCQLVARALGVPRVGPTDNFFDLGGHSLRAAALVSEVRATLGVALTLGAVFAAPTAAGLARALADPTVSDGALGVLLPLRPATADAGPPLFCVHPAGGLAWSYAGLLATLPRQVPVYGLQSRALLDPTAAPTSIDQMADDYVDQIRRVQPAGPYRLAGWSVGGVIAQAMAARLRRGGERVPLLALLDAYPADQWRDLPAPDESAMLRALLHMAGSDESVLDGAPVTRDAVLAALRDRGNAMATLDPAALDAVATVVGLNARLMREHRHEVFDGDALFVAAVAPRPETWLTRSGWLPYVTGGLVSLDLECTHPQLVQPAQLARIGAAIAERLR
ncbi:amino acid adenylation domain-containing protein [Pilimelia columellifera]|uniref:Enterobactin non-ribosomal peptide synthetase EntF n=1 Tax=Pilimelia columellifera subsp. columellifera TaxID=706583 RepID=A0ABP6ACR1_9ACTN